MIYGFICLGSAAKVDWIQIRWPSGLVERYDKLAADAIHTLKEEEGAAVEAAPEKSAGKAPDSAQ